MIVADPEEEGSNHSGCGHIAFLDLIGEIDFGFNKVEHPVSNERR